MKIINLLLLFILYILLIKCSNQNKNSKFSEIRIYSDINGIIYINKLPSINELRPKIFEQNINGKILSNSGSIDNAINVNFEGINYTISWNTENKINYISTNDENFKSNEGISMNMTLKDVNKIQNMKILKDVGWGYYGKLNSGWNIGFCVDESCTGKEIRETDKVNWIFKR